ncbi:hypothetical protein LB504_003123 [Fusarium proliferatum]|nr:hypothetical protein LB504_003123 [Fusarium proliferatum]
MKIDLDSRTKSYFSSYHFDNIPFSSGIKANHYPAVAQQSQLQNYYAKHNWAMMTANDGHGVDSVRTDKFSVKALEANLPPGEI